MLDAAARHRDMVSSRSRFVSRRLREERRRWLWLPALDLESVITRRGVHQQMRRGALGSLTRRPSRHLVRLRLRAVHLGPCAERPQPERTGCQFAGSGPKRPKPKTQNPDPPISLSLRRNCEHRREETQRRGAPFGGGEEMEMTPSSRSVLSSCNWLAARVPRMTASAGARRKEKGVVCILSGSGEKDVVQRRIRRRAAFSLLLASPALSVAFSAYGKSKTMNPYDERRLLQQNKKIQEANRAPDDFPNFIREGFQVKIVTTDNYITRDSGLMYEDIKVGTGDSPKDGQQIIFHYVGYNEAGRRIDSTYIQGSPAKIRLGNGTLVPGFEEGVRDMKPGGKRRIIIPPELGPPVGPSTFFSAKQFEVFDVELLAVQDCQRRTIAFYSDVVCS
ncbi:peptidyl-prolyl cis-trans isomerase FKBP20-2, chloroplastic-like [Miscanthus floridulus]|uniref:peptidyl-prolyl cis-trans isomerase FKBP20-2, chloroplastic-like n=1 Tax=Miscanthus floridulus TaxID=154761 RepID=UPI0034575F9C